MINSGNTNELRIIAGKWKGRKIPFPSLPGLRPTQGRIRETLFSWLMSDVRHSHCLDLFAGSGSLGFEALSREAQTVTFIDSAPEVIKAIKQNIQTLHINNASVARAEIPCKSRLLLKRKFDVIFLDPPFGKDLLNETIQWIGSQNLLYPNGLIYIECEKNLEKAMPKNWQQIKHKETKSIVYSLYQYLEDQ
jgi:16S rRNA (guanine966-N2)-methyltransferase